MNATGQPTGQQMRKMQNKYIDSAMERACWTKWVVIIFRGMTNSNSNTIPSTTAKRKSHKLLNQLLSMRWPPTTGSIFVFLLLLIPNWYIVACCGAAVASEKLSFQKQIYWAVRRRRKQIKTKKNIGNLHATSGRLSHFAFLSTHTQQPCCSAFFITCTVNHSIVIVNAFTSSGRCKRDEMHE